MDKRSKFVISRLINNGNNHWFTALLYHRAKILIFSGMLVIHMGGFVLTNDVLFIIEPNTQTRLNSTVCSVKILSIILTMKYI